MLFLYCGKCKDYNDSLQKIIILRNVFDCNAWSPVLSSTEILYMIETTQAQYLDYNNIRLSPSESYKQLASQLLGWTRALALRDHVGRSVYRSSYCTHPVLLF